MSDKIDIHIAGKNSFPCPVGWTVDEARNEIRSRYDLKAGGINKNGLAMRSTDIITSDGDYHFVNFQECQGTGITKEDVKEQAKLGTMEAFTERKQSTMAISNISDTKLRNLLSVFQLNVVEEEIMEPDTMEADHGLKFIPFNWDGRDEDDTEAMNEAYEHVHTQLTRFGVQFGRSAYKLCDVHKNRKILDVDHSKFVLRGGTDFIIVPYKTSVNMSGPRNLCVLFELKTDEKMEAGIQAHENQAVAEIIAARYVSNQPGILLILTDLVGTSAIFEFSFNESADKFSIVEYKRGVTLEFMASKVSSFLNNVSIPDATYEPPNEVNPVSEREKAVVAFKKQKVERFSSFELESLQDMQMDRDNWSVKERAQLVANLFSSFEQPIPMPISVQYALYS